MRQTARPFTFFCRGPFATLAASALLLTTLPAAAVDTDAAKQSLQPAKPGTARPVAAKIDKAKPFAGGSDDGQSMRPKQPRNKDKAQPAATGSPTPKNRISAQYNPKELGVDKRK